jgi:hypothetical protein
MISRYRVQEQAPGSWTNRVLDGYAWSCRIVWIGFTQGKLSVVVDWRWRRQVPQSFWVDSYGFRLFETHSFPPRVSFLQFSFRGITVVPKATIVHGGVLISIHKDG